MDPSSLHIACISFELGWEIVKSDHVMNMGNSYACGSHHGHTLSTVHVLTVVGPPQRPPTVKSKMIWALPLAGSLCYCFAPKSCPRYCVCGLGAKDFHPHKVLI